MLLFLERLKLTEKHVDQPTVEYFTPIQHKQDFPFLCDVNTDAVVWPVSSLPNETFLVSCGRMS